MGVRPWLVLDSAHNIASIEVLLDTLDEIFPGKSRRFIFAASKDKDIRGMLRRLLPRCDQLVLTSFANARGMSAEALLGISEEVAGELAAEEPSRRICSVKAVPDSSAAWQFAIDGLPKDSVLCVTGSFFLAGELQAAMAEEARRVKGNFP